MAGHDHVDPVRGRIGPQVLEIVNDEDRPAGETDRLGFEIFLGPAGRIDVSPDRSHGCDPTQRRDDIGRADVTAVDDMIDASQASFRFRPQKSVSIGNYAYPEGHRVGRPAFASITLHAAS